MISFVMSRIDEEALSAFSLSPALSGLFEVVQQVHPNSPVFHQILFLVLINCHDFFHRIQ